MDYEVAPVFSQEDANFFDSVNSLVNDGDMVDQLVADFNNIPGADTINLDPTPSFTASVTPQQRAMMLERLVKSIGTTSIAGLTVETFSELVDTMILEVCFEVHKTVYKKGVAGLFETSGTPPVVKNQQQNSDDGNKKYRTDVDIYGADASSIAADDVQCLQCGSLINGARYAQHLSRCMGRSSRRGWNPVNYGLDSYSSSIGMYEDSDEYGDRRKRNPSTVSGRPAPSPKKQKPVPLRPPLPSVDPMGSLSPDNQPVAFVGDNMDLGYGDDLLLGGVGDSGGDEGYNDEFSDDDADASLPSDDSDEATEWNAPKKQKKKMMAPKAKNGRPQSVQPKNGQKQRIR